MTNEKNSLRQLVRNAHYTPVEFELCTNHVAPLSQLSTYI